MLRNVLIRTVIPKTATFTGVGLTTIVLSLHNEKLYFHNALQDHFSWVKSGNYVSIRLICLFREKVYIPKDP